MDGYVIEELPGKVSNPYAPPRLGSDFHHQGVDFFHGYAEGGGAAPGLPVHAILSGRVAMVLADRFPYGNAVIVEVDPAYIPADIAAALPTPDVDMPLLAISSLTCPPVDAPEWDETSLYVLYAHLEETAPLTLGQQVTCGDILGRIGKSGNAVNPHLHLEARWGPAGVQFESMGHYSLEVSDDERGAYCLWRVSGRFQHFDPLMLFQLP